MATFTDQLTKIRRIAILENKKAATVAGAFGSLRLGLRLSLVTDQDT